jgi:hypothetical protein
MCKADNKANLIAWYRDVFGFALTVATTLYDEQLLRNKNTLVKLDNINVDNICSTIQRDPTKPIAKVAATRLKLAIFWIKHQDQTLCIIGVLTKLLVWVTLATIMTLKEQKQLKDNWLSNKKEPEYTATTLDLSLASKAFKRVETILTRVRRVTSVPLVYVVRHQLIPEEEDEDPIFREANSKYTSHDQETFVHSPILTERADLDLTYNELEADGPFVLPVLTNSKKV